MVGLSQGRGQKTLALYFLKIWISFLRVLFASLKVVEKGVVAKHIWCVDEHKTKSSRTGPLFPTFRTVHRNRCYHCFFVLSSSIVQFNPFNPLFLVHLVHHQLTHSTFHSTLSISSIFKNNTTPIWSLFPRQNKRWRRIMRSTLGRFSSHDHANRPVSMTHHPSRHMLRSQLKKKRT